MIFRRYGLFPLLPKQGFVKVIFGASMAKLYQHSHHKPGRAL